MKHLILIACLTLFGLGYSTETKPIMHTYSTLLVKKPNNIMTFNAGLLQALPEIIELISLFNGTGEEIEHVLTLYKKYIKAKKDVSQIEISHQLKKTINDYTFVSEPDTKIDEALNAYQSKTTDLISPADFVKATNLSHKILIHQPAITPLNQRLGAKDFLFYMALADNNSHEGKLLKAFNTIFEPWLNAIQAEEKKLNEDKIKEEKRLHQKWFEALAEDNVQVVKKSIDKGIDLDKKSPSGASIFQIIAQNNSINSLPILIQKKDFNSGLHKGYYTILNTVKLAQPSFFNALFDQLEKQKVEVNYFRLIEHISDQDDYQYLKELLQKAQLSQKQLYEVALRNIRAAKPTHLATILQHGLQPDLLRNHESLSWKCIGEDNAEALAILLNHGASINYRDSFFSYKESLLSRAIDWEKIKCVELLLKMEAPIIIIGKGKYAERMAKLKNVILPQLPSESKATIDRYESHDKVLQKWFDSAKNNNMLYVRQQIENGFEIDTPNNEGNTLLGLALKNKSNLVDYLILSGATFPPANTTGESLLTDAIDANDLAFLYQIRRYIDNKNININWPAVIDKSISSFHGNAEIFKSIIYFSGLTGDDLVEIAHKVIDQNKAKYLETLFTFGLRKESQYNGKSIIQYAKEANKPSIHAVLK